ncbi:DUF4256 domain-containing protein [soil metagenome]
MAIKNNRTLSTKLTDELMMALKNRFEKNMHRHKAIEWKKVEHKLKENSDLLWSLYEMERTGGEPDVTNHDKKSGHFIFMDCATESPKERRSICYDQKALNSRKENKPKSSAIAMAESMGIELLTEEEYLALQKLEDFDTKTSSWISTPEEVRNLGGALFCDRRFGKVFIYHNGAESYYAGRGFRGKLKV